MESEENDEAERQGGSSTMATETIVLISVGSLFIALLLFLVLWFSCRWCRNRRKRRREGEPRSITGDIKIETLGTHYKIASIQNVYGGLTPDRKFSMASDRKFSEISASQRECEEFLPTERDEYAIQSDSIVKGEGATLPLRNGKTFEKEKLQGESSSSSSSSSSAARRPSDSTYLDFSSATATAREAKGASPSSPLTMAEMAEMVEMQRKMRNGDLSLHGVNARAPLAVEESLYSLRASKDSLAFVTSSVTYQQRERPKSEYQMEERIYFPKLPPKKKRYQQHKSAYDIIEESKDPVSPNSNNLSSKSETHLASNGLEDYDDLPESDRVQQPILPPKTVPVLPPKQKINKSQDDLARIETQFKSSLSELRFGSSSALNAKGAAEKGANDDDDDDDYDDLPGEAADDNKHEFDDYDEPPALQPGHTSTPVAPAGASGASGEYDDYDDPIHHSSARR